MQLVQILGAIAILAAFAAAQFGFMDQRSWSFLGLNFAGAAVLAVVAYEERQWGFLLLEVVWALVSAWGLFGRATGRGSTVHP
jgi:steroid 5-alpha reductase family enzyme